MKILRKKEQAHEVEAPTAASLRERIEAAERTTAAAEEKCRQLANKYAEHEGQCVVLREEIARRGAAVDAAKGEGLRNAILKDKSDAVTRLTIELAAGNELLKERIAASNAHGAALEVSIKAQRDYLAARSEADVQSDVDRVLATHKESKGLMDADRASLVDMRRSAPDAFARMYPLGPLDKPHLFRSLVGFDHSPVTFAEDRGAGGVASPLQRVKELMRDGATYETALVRAREER